MKAKTVVTWLLSLALSATVCAGLTGCGEDNGDDDLANFVSEKVTEEEWSSALQKSNFMGAKLSGRETSQSNGQDEQGNSIVGLTTDEWEYVETEEIIYEIHHWQNTLTVGGKSELEEAYTGEYYYELLKNDKSINYTKIDDGAWEVESGYPPKKDDGYLWLICRLNYEFDEFEYNEEAGGYVADLSSDFAFMTLKFKDKKLVWFLWGGETLLAEGQTGESWQQAISITYGHSVALPVSNEVPCGTYKLSEAKIILDGKPVTVRVGESLDGMVVKEDDMVVTLNQDGTAVVSIADMKGKGIVRQAGNTVAIINLDDALKFMEFSGVWDGNNKLTISLSQNMTYILVKQP